MMDEDRSRWIRIHNRILIETGTDDEISDQGSIVAGISSLLSVVNDIHMEPMVVHIMLSLSHSVVISFTNGGI